MPQLTTAVKWVMVATIAAFFAQMIGRRTMGAAALTPSGPLYTYDLYFGVFGPLLKKGYVWQLITYMFLHGGATHLLLNMLGLYFMGPPVERQLGSRRFLALYFAAGLCASVMWLLMGGMGQGLLVGASGGIFALMGAIGVIMWDRRLQLLLFFVIPVTMTGKTLVIGTAVVSLILYVNSMAGGNSNVAHSAHLGGLLAGFVYMRALLGAAQSQWHHPRKAKRSGSWMGDVVQSWKRRKIRVVQNDSAAAPSENEVDSVLEKLAAGGWSALSADDRGVLDRASKN